MFSGDVIVLSPLYQSSSLTEATRSESSFQERRRSRGKLAQPSYLFVNLGELLQVILQEGNFLLLGSTASSIVTVQLYTLHQDKGSAESASKLPTLHPSIMRKSHSKYLWEEIPDPTKGLF